MTIERTIKIEKKALAEYGKLLALNDANPEDYGHSKLSNVDTWTAHFPYGYFADIKINASEDDFWTEGVLFDKDGGQLCCSDVCSSLEGEWRFEYEGNTFVVNVVADE